MSRFDLDRRGFLASLGAAALVAACGGGGAAGGDASGLAAVLGDSQAKVAALAAKARSALSLADGGAAVTALTAHCGVDGSSGVDATRTALDEAITADFVAQRTVDVDGWVLSKTEALLVAAVA